MRWKRLLNGIFTSVVIAIIFAVMWCLIGLFKPQLKTLITYIINVSDNASEDGNDFIVTSIFGAGRFIISLICTPIITKAVETYLVPPDTIPCIQITSPQSQNKNLTGPRVKNGSNLCAGVNLCSSNWEGKIRLAHAKIVNVGSRNISQVKIKKEIIVKLLKPNEEHIFYFIVPEPDDGSKKGKRFIVPCSIQTPTGRIYKGKYQIAVDPSLALASFEIYKKMKRRI